MAENIQFEKTSDSSSELEILTRPASLGDQPIRKMTGMPLRKEATGSRPSLILAPVASKSVQPGMALSLLKALSRRWKPAALIGSVLAAVVATVIWTQLPPPKPSASAKLYIPATPQTVLGQHPDPPLERGTQIALIRSRLVLNAALRNPEVNALPAIQQQVAKGADELDWLAKNLQVDFPEGPEIIRIALSYEDGEQAKILVNAVKDAYLSEIHGNSKRLRNEKLTSLNKHAERADTTLKTLRDQAQALSNDNVALDDKQFKLQQELASNQAAMVKTQILTVRSDQLRLKAEESALKGKTAGTAFLPPEVVEGIIAKDPEVVETLAKRDELEVRYRKSRDAAADPDNNDSTKKLNVQLEAMKKNYEQLRVNLRGQVEERLRNKSKAEIDSHVKLLKEEIDSTNEMEKLLTSEYDRLNAYIKDGNKKNFDLEPLRIRIKLAEGLFERVNGMITNLNLEQDALPRVVKLEDAYIVPVEETKRKLMMSGVGAFGAIALVCVLVGFLELNRRRIESTESVTNQLGLAVIGTVPRHLSPMAKRYGRTSKEGWESMLTESMNSTRTMLMHGHGLSSARVIQIISPVSGEGKTTLSTHLAASLALAGQRTILIDGDLRNPNAYKPFQLPPNEPGLCEVLRGETTMEAVIRPTPIEGLMFLPAGKWGDDTAQRLASMGLQEVFGYLRQQFDFVVVDSSPILPVSDPLLFARHVDGVLVSLMQGVSRMTLVEDANRRLASLRVPVLGAVLHGTKGQTYGYGSNYAYSSQPK